MHFDVIGRIVPALDGSDVYHFEPRRMVRACDIALPPVRNPFVERQLDQKESFAPSRRNACRVDAAPDIPLLGSDGRKVIHIHARTNSL